MKKMKCQECGVAFAAAERLMAVNPFDAEEQIFGCPSCKSVDCFAAVCDEPGCTLEVSCGTPTPNGYRSTCSKHRPA